MSRIFISYRRGDSAGHTGRLLDSLESRFGAGNVFRDIEDLEAGVDFPKALEHALSKCDVVLVMIGREWASASNSKGRRLDQPDDFVRIEVASALARKNVTVIPVLVNEGQLPRVEELPEDLHPLVHRNAIELSDTRWDYDVSRLSETLGRCLGVEHENVRESPKRQGAPGGLFNLLIGIAVAVIAFVGLELYWSSELDDAELDTLTSAPSDIDAANFVEETRWDAATNSEATTPKRDGYQALVNACQQQPAWEWPCDVPAIPDTAPFLAGTCTCEGRILQHIETNLYRCEALPVECGGVSFQATLGYEPNMQWYREVFDE